MKEIEIDIFQFVQNPIGFCTNWKISLQNAHFAMYFMFHPIHVLRENWRRTTIKDPKDLYGSSKGSRGMGNIWKKFLWDVKKVRWLVGCSQSRSDLSKKCARSRHQEVVSTLYLVSTSVTRIRGKNVNLCFLPANSNFILTIF